MKQFKGTVPLMVSLKNEALRERHWLQLMEKTGQHFDMTPERFTLENMFGMQLYKYQVEQCKATRHICTCYYLTWC